MSDEEQLAESREREDRLRVRFDIPALERYVDYLIQRDDQQKQINQLAEQVKTLTDKLRQSGAALGGAVADNA